MFGIEAATSMCTHTYATCAHMHTLSLTHSHRSFRLSWNQNVNTWLVLLYFTFTTSNQWKCYRPWNLMCLAHNNLTWSFLTRKTKFDDLSSHPHTLTHTHTHTHTEVNSYFYTSVFKRSSHKSSIFRNVHRLTNFLKHLRGLFLLSLSITASWNPQDRKLCRCVCVCVCVTPARPFTSQSDPPTHSFQNGVILFLS